MKGYGCLNSLLVGGVGGRVKGQIALQMKSFFRTTLQTKRYECSKNKPVIGINKDFNENLNHLFYVTSSNLGS